MDAVLEMPSLLTSETDFAERLLAAYQGGALSHMIALGHRLRLFDVMSVLPPETSDAIAAAAGLAERYVREWLSVMVVEAVVKYDPVTQQYHLPAAHAAWLTRAAAPNNLAVTAQFVTLMGEMSDSIESCFRSGAGLPYSAYPSFHRVMAEDSEQTVVSALLNNVIPMIPGLSERLETGINVLDAGCGAGKALLLLAQQFPASRFTGLDLCHDAFAQTQRLAAEMGLANLRFEQRDLSLCRTLGDYDLVTTFDAVHDQADPQGLLNAIAASLSPDGVYLMQDIRGSSHLENNLDHPCATLLYAISCVHCTPVSLGQGGPGLGAMWGEELALAMLARAGFRDVHVQTLPHDPLNSYYVCRRN